jgi:pyridoxine 5'-phosphate synthase PdxJ
VHLNVNNIAVHEKARETSEPEQVDADSSQVKRAKG